MSAARRAKVEAELVEGHKGVVVAIQHRGEGVWHPLPGLDLDRDELFLRGQPILDQEREDCPFGCDERGVMVCEPKD